MTGTANTLRPLLLLACAAALLSIPAHPARAAGCDDAVSTVELTKCAEDDYNRSDAELNRLYALAVASIETRDGGMDPGQLKEFAAALKKSQRAWIAFKEADCNELTGWEWFGGTGANAAVWACLTAKTQARSEELKDRYGVQ